MWSHRPPAVLLRVRTRLEGMRHSLILAAVLFTMSNSAYADPPEQRLTTVGSLLQQRIRAQQNLVNCANALEGTRTHLKNAPSEPSRRQIGSQIPKIEGWIAEARRKIAEIDTRIAVEKQMQQSLYTQGDKLRKVQASYCRCMGYGTARLDAEGLHLKSEDRAERLEHQSQYCAVRTSLEKSGRNRSRPVCRQRSWSKAFQVGYERYVNEASLQMTPVGTIYLGSSSSSNSGR